MAPFDCWQWFTAQRRIRSMDADVERMIKSSRADSAGSRRACFLSYRGDNGEDFSMYVEVPRAPRCNYRHTPETHDESTKMWWDEYLAHLSAFSSNGEQPTRSNEEWHRIRKRLLSAHPDKGNKDPLAIHRALNDLKRFRLSRKV